MRTQEGYNAVSFLRGNRPKTSDPEKKSGQLQVTESGRALEKFVKRIDLSSIAVFVVLFMVFLLMKVF